jgi:hypothetical protein
MSATIYEINPSKKPIDPTSVPQEYLSGYHRFCLEEPYTMDYVSPNLCSILGYTLDEIREIFHDKYSLLVYKEDYLKFKGFLDSLAAKEQTLLLQYRLVCKNGRIIYVSDTTTSSVLPDGRMYAFSVVTEITDVTRDINQHSLPVQLLNSYGVVTCTYEKFPRITHINSQMLNFLNITEDDSSWLEYVKENIFFMIPYEESNVFRGFLEKADKTGLPQKIEHLVMCCDEKKIMLSGWLNISRNEFGKREYTIVYTNKTDNNDSIRNIHNNPFMYALSSSYHLIFAFKLLSDTVECIYGQDTTTIGSLYDASMTIESAKDFWINNYIADDDRENMRFFLDQVTIPGKWDDDFIPRTDFHVKWKDGNTYNYTGVGVQMDPFLVLLCCRRNSRDNDPHVHVMESIALTKMNEMMDFFFFRESDSIGMILLEKTAEDYSLIYTNKRICTYLGIDKRTYLHLVSGKFPLENVLESSGVTRPDFETLVSTGEVISPIKGRDYVDAKDVRLVCTPYEYENRTVYSIFVYETTAQPAPAIPIEGIFVRTFGHFDVFVDGIPVKFSSSKEKELLALLIDRNGGTLSSHEAINYLWEDEAVDEKVSNRYRKLAMNLKNTLSSYGIEHILINNHGVRSIDVTALTCDYYEMLGGNEQYRKTFHNIYMEDYSWAEDTLATLWEYS